jgi:hypothetical protein
MKNLNIIIIAVLVGVIGLGAGFFAGVKYQENQQPDFRNRAFLANGQRMMAGQNGATRGGLGFRPVSGEILSVGNNTITVKLPDNSSKIVMLSPTTSINKAASASAADLTVGETVAVFGQTNPDGSVTAQNIQINPSFRGQAR